MDAFFGILIAIGCILPIFLAFFALTRRDAGIRETMLALLLTQFVLIFIAAYGDAQGYDAFELLLINAAMLIAPTFFIYLRVMTLGKSGFSRRQLFHYIPYLSSWLYFLILLDGDPDSLDRLFIQPHFDQRPFLFNLFYVAELCCIPIYSILGLCILRDHRKSLSQQFSYSEGLDLKWAGVLIWFTLGIWFVIAIPDFLQLYLTRSMIPDTRSGFVIAAIMVACLCFYGLRQTNIFLAPSITTPAKPETVVIDEPEAVEKYKKSGLSEPVAHQQMSALKEYMDTHKPYLQPKLSHAELAEMLALTPHDLSNLINQHMGCNFYDFINQYRVAAFKEKIEANQDQQFTLLAIAMDCGFNSKSAFNRVFKKETGQTPSAYVKNWRRYN